MVLLKQGRKRKLAMKKIFMVLVPLLTACASAPASNADTFEDEEISNYFPAFLPSPKSLDEVPHHLEKIELSFQNEDASPSGEEKIPALGEEKSLATA